MQSGINPINLNRKLPSKKSRFHTCYLIPDAAGMIYISNTNRIYENTHYLGRSILHDLITGMQQGNVPL
jgi:hypothetical protein